MTILEYLRSQKRTEIKRLCRRHEWLCREDAHDLIIECVTGKMRREGLGWHDEINLHHIRHELKCDILNEQQKRATGLTCYQWLWVIDGGDSGDLVPVEVEDARDYTTDVIDALLAPLDEREEHVARQIILGGDTQKAVAADLGVSQQMASKLCTSAKEKMRRVCDAEGLRLPIGRKWDKSQRIVNRPIGELSSDELMAEYRAAYRPRRTADAGLRVHRDEIISEMVGRGMLSS